MIADVRPAADAHRHPGRPDARSPSRSSPAGLVRVEVWHIVVIAAAGSRPPWTCRLARPSSSRWSAVHDVVNAVALNSAAFNGARIVRARRGWPGHRACVHQRRFPRQRPDLSGGDRVLCPDARGRSAHAAGAALPVRLREVGRSGEGLHYVRDTDLVLLAIFVVAGLDLRHELRRHHPGARPGRPPYRRDRLRLPDGGDGRRLPGGSPVDRLLASSAHRHQSAAPSCSVPARSPPPSCRNTRSRSRRWPASASGPSPWPQPATRPSSWRCRTHFEAG